MNYGIKPGSNVLQMDNHTNDIFQRKKTTLMFNYLYETRTNFKYLADFGHTHHRIKNI